MKQDNRLYNKRFRKSLVAITTLAVAFVIAGAVSPYYAAHTNGTQRRSGLSAVAKPLVYVSPHPVSAQSTSAASDCTSSASPANTIGQVKQTITVPSAGTYRVWSRIKPPTAVDNAYYLQFDGGNACNVGDIAYPANTWSWTNLRSGDVTSTTYVTLSAGSHVVTYTGKEPGLQIDKILLLGDPGCTPTGLGDNCTTAADTTKPTVTLTSPANGSMVRVGSIINFAATASDNVGVTKVEFFVGSTMVSSTTKSPYTYAWDSTGFARTGEYLYARAFDAAGNYTTTPATGVTFTTGTTPTTTPGDVNGDGRVNAIDLSSLISHDGQNYPAADFNKDGTVGAADLAILLSKWTW